MSMHGLWDGGLITKAVREQKTYKTALPSRQIEDQLRGEVVLKRRKREELLK